MQIPAKQHIDNSVKRLEDILLEVKTITGDLSEETLNKLEGPQKWSILQCLKHLSIANGIYVKNIASAFEKYPKQVDDVFRSHWKGDWFTKMISPKNDGEVKNSMKTMKSMDPETNLDPKQTLEEFFAIHDQFIELIKASEDYSLNKVKVPTALGPMVKLRLGDAYRFLIGHTERHLTQLKRIRNAVV
jgi:hypothetical protein